MCTFACIYLHKTMYVSFFEDYETPPATLAIEVGLHTHLIDADILTPETLVFEQQPILFGRTFHPLRSRGCCPVRATGCSLPCGRYYLAPLTGNKEENKELLVPHVRPTPKQLLWYDQFTHSYHVLPLKFY